MIAAFLILAQATFMPVPTPSPEPSPSGHHEGHRHHHLSPSSSPQPQVRVTMVNATSVPTISVGTSGTNLPITYPDFCQGEWTANEALTNPEVHYVVRTTNGSIMGQKTIHYKPVSSQFLLLTGDLTTTGPAEKLSSLGYQQETSGFQCAPNLQFHLFPYTLVSSNPCHYRIFNAMPGKMMTLKSVEDKGKSTKELALLTPGNSVLLVGQPESVDYDAEIDGQTYRLSIRQEGAEGNCLIPFFLREGKPDFVRVFEEP